MSLSRRAAALIIVLLSAIISPTETAQPAELADLQRRIAAFIKAWVTERNTAQTLAFVDDSAYRDKPVFGETCEGWLRPHMPLEKARKTLGDYLVGTTNSYPAGTDVSQILVNLSTAEWASFAVNDVSRDRYILMRVDERSIRQMFEGKKNPYREVLARHLKNASPIYWSTFGILLPNHEGLVVYAAWQHLRDNWYISAIDVTCPGM